LFEQLVEFLLERLWRDGLAAEDGSFGRLKIGKL
jgi:hypothetical protein